MESCFRKPEIEKGFQFSLTTKKKHLLDAHCVSTDNFKHNRDKWLVDLEIFITATLRFGKIFLMYINYYPTKNARGEMLRRKYDIEEDR